MPVGPNSRIGKGGLSALITAILAAGGIVAGAISYTATQTYLDNVAAVFGTDSDSTILYDETTDDRLEVTGASVHVTPDVALVGGANALTVGDDSEIVLGTNSDWKLRYDEAGVDSLMLSEATVDTLAIKGSAITNFAAATDTAGNDIFMELQQGGADGGVASAGQNGANLFFNGGAGSNAVTADAAGGTAGGFSFTGGAGGNGQGSGNGGAGGTIQFLGGDGGADGGTGTDGDGGDILVIPGLKAGTGNDGEFLVRQPGGVAGTDEFFIRDIGTRSEWGTRQTSFRIYAGGTTVLGTVSTVDWTFNKSLFPSASNGLDFGSAALEWRDLYLAGAIKLGTGQDAGLERTAAGVAEITDGSTGLGFLQTAGDKFRAATQAVDSTTLTADDTLSATLAASRKYRFRLVYYINVGDTVADGFKLDFNGGTATATTFIAQIAAQDAGATAFLAGTNARVTALNTAFSCTSTANFMVVAEGAIVVNGAGTFIPKFAKVADVGTGITAQIGSTLTVWDCP